LLLVPVVASAAETFHVGQACVPAWQFCVTVPLILLPALTRTGALCQVMPAGQQFQLAKSQAPVLPCHANTGWRMIVDPTVFSKPGNKYIVWLWLVVGGGGTAQVAVRRP
jgi:hypothetical protein